MLLTSGEEKKCQNKRETALILYEEGGDIWVEKKYAGS